VTNDPRVEAASVVGFAQMRHDPAVWYRALDHALPDMLAAADAVDPLRAPGTVCVRLDGLADKITVRVALAFEGEAEAWNLSTDSGDRLARIVANIVERMLQSLAVR
jgi:hypothetical protein